MEKKCYHLSRGAIITSFIFLISLATVTQSNTVLAIGSTGKEASSAEITTIPGIPILINSETDKVVYSFNDQVIHLAGSIQPLISVSANGSAASVGSSQTLMVHYQAYSIAQPADYGKVSWNVTGDVPVFLYGSHDTNTGTFSVSLINPGYLDHREGVYAIMLSFDGRKHIAFFVVQEDLSISNIFYREL
jgi:hypothetical protein